MQRIHRLVSVSILAFLFAARPSGQQPAIVFEHVTVIPMDRERALPDQTVVISGGRIEAIGGASTTRVPAGATRIDGRGRFLIPTLSEMHAHVPGDDAARAERLMFLYVANGIGTIRSMQGDPRHFALRERARRGELLAPTMYLAAPAFRATPATPAEVTAGVAEQRKAGYDMLKIMEGMTRPAFDALVAAAARTGMRFVGHVTTDVGLQRALEAKYWTIEHLDGYLEGLAPFGVNRQALERAGGGGEGGINILAQVDESRIRVVAAQTKAAGTWNVPTQMVHETRFNAMDPETLRSWPEMRYADPAEVEEGIENKRKYMAAYSAQDRQRLIAIRRRLIKALNDEGGGLLLGSDSPNRWNVPGFSIHRELAMYVAAGLTPYQALATGTRNVAVHFGTLKTTGTVEAGKRADLVLLEGNPLQNVSNTSRISGVMIGGRWLPKSDIDRRLDQIAAEQMAARTATAEKRWDPPRTPDGQPDISGYWSERSDVGTQDIQIGPERVQSQITGLPPMRGKVIIDPPDGKLPYQPWAAEQASFYRAEYPKPSRPELMDPVSRCFMEGVPRIMYQGGFGGTFIQILQTPTYIATLHEYGHHYRVIYLDNRPPPSGGLKLWMGASRGRWEGNTLIVEVTNHNDKTWFDHVGSFHSDAMRVIERWTFVERDRIEYQATIDDPKVYTRPWTIALTLGRNPPEEQWEHAACEGNKVVHVVFGLPFDHER